MEDEFIHWDKKYNTGDKEVDEEHKKLVNILNALYRGITIGKKINEDIAFKSTVKRLVDYVVYHFSNEETLMEEYEFAGIEQHKEWHREFATMILEVVELYNKDPRLVPNRLLRKLRDWLLEHIAVRDKQMVSIVLKSKKDK